MRGSAAFRSAIAPGGVLAGPWVQNELWRRARAKPSLDLRLAERKSLVDATTGQNLVSFTRASSGTYVDSQGVIRTATTNLLLRSEEFDNASWSKGGLLAFGSGSFTNAITAPTGTVTADLLTEDTSTGQHRVWQTASNTVNTNVHTVSFYAKAKERTRIYVGIAESPSFSRQGNATFNLANGTVVSFASGNNGATGGTASIVDAGNGWYRCSYSLVLGGTNTAIFCDLNIVSAGTTISYTGDGTSGIYLWGAQLEQSSTVGEYIPTTSTINSAPRFDHAITSSTTNLLLRSEEFDNVSWGPIAGTVSANQTPAPNGTTTADKLIATNGGPQGQVFQGVAIVSGATCTGSVYVKGGGFDRFELVLLSNNNTTPYGRSVIDPNTGAIITGAFTQNGGTNASSNVQVLGNGWYRFSVTVTYPATGAAGMRLAVSNSDSSNGDGVKGVFLWGAQLEQSSTVGAYVPTTTAAATSSTTESLGLLVEESRTNLLLLSGNLYETGTGGGSWIYQTGTMSDNTQVAPDGTTTADTLTTTGGALSIYQSATVTASTTYTGSVYVRLGTMQASDFKVAVYNNSTPGFIAVDVAPSQTPTSSGWTRISYSFTTPAGCTSVRWYPFRNSAGLGSCTVHLWGAQLEAGAFPTSYIPTTTATVTRSADVASISGSNFSSWYRQDEGTVFAEYLLPNLLAGTVASFDDGTANNRWQMRYTTAPDAGRYRFVSASGSFDYTSQTALPIANRMSKSAYVARSTDQQWATNAVISSIAGSQATMPTVDRLQIGNGAASDQAKQLTIRRLTYWPQRLSNSALQSITQ